LRRQQNRIMAQRPQLARPAMRRATGFQANLQRRKLGEKAEHLATPQLPAQDRPFGRIHPMQLKNAL